MKIIVAADGSGDYKTIGQALLALENERETGKRSFIFVKKGVYR